MDKFLSIRKENVPHGKVTYPPVFDAFLEAELRKLICVDLLIVDDFAFGENQVVPTYWEATEMRVQVIDTEGTILDSFSLSR